MLDRWVFCCVARLTVIAPIVRREQEPIRSSVFGTPAMRLARWVSSARRDCRGESSVATHMGRKQDFVSVCALADIRRVGSVMQVS